MPRYGQVQVSFGPPLTRMVKYLIIVSGAIFVLTYLGLQLFHWTWPLAWLSLQPYDVIHRLFLWQLVTYLFLHGGFFHIIFNLLMLWMFGSELEYRWGGRRFLFYFFLTGIGAGLCDVILNTLLAPGLRTATIGNSGAVYGVLLAYGMLFPDRPVLFALMIPMKAKWLVLIMAAIEFLSSLGGPGRASRKPAGHRRRHRNSRSWRSAGQARGACSEPRRKGRHRSPSERNRREIAAHPTGIPARTRTSKA